MWEAIDVITRLYDGVYRVLHIAAHGVFDEMHADGKARTGVVLSGGLLITAAEIEMMGAHTLVDVFANVPGIQSSDRGGPGGTDQPGGEDCIGHVDFSVLDG